MVLRGTLCSGASQEPPLAGVDPHGIAPMVLEGGNTLWFAPVLLGSHRCLLRTRPAALAGAALPCRGYLEGHCKH